MSTIKNIFNVSTTIADTYNFMPLHHFFRLNKIPRNKKINMPNKISKKGITHDISLILKAYVQGDMHEIKKPLLLYFSNADKETRSNISSSKSLEDFTFTMVVIGIKESFAEAILMSSAHSIIEDLTVDVPIIFINSMGDVACSTKYIRELDVVIKKYIDSDKISMKCINILHKMGPIAACKLINTDDEYVDIRDNMPSAIKFLNDSSRDHFQSVIEYLDAHGSPYTLCHDLIDESRHTTHTMFKITSNNNKDVSASGKRIDGLSQHLFELDIPVSYITINFNKKTNRNTKIQKNTNKHPKIFFLHSGYKARLQTLPIIKNLRKNNINIDHCVYSTKVLDQLAYAENSNCKFIFILGQQEILENTVRIHNVVNKSQEVIPMKHLINRLRRIK